MCVFLMEKMGNIDRLKFEGILMEKIGLDGKMEGKNLIENNDGIHSKKTLRPTQLES